MCLPRDMNISGPGVERHEVKGVMTSSNWEARVCPVTYTDNNVEERERRGQRDKGGRSARGCIRYMIVISFLISLPSAPV